VWASAHTSVAADDPPKAPAAGISPQTAKINEFIAKKWEEAGIAKPAAKASDHEYMRRVFLDLIGRIPTVEEILDFEQDKSPNKRVKLVQRVLNEKKFAPKVGGKVVSSVPGLAKFPIDYSAAYARNFAEIWSVWLLTRSGVDAMYREQLMMWLEDQFDTNAPYRDFVTGLITATGKSNENGAVHFVFRHIGDPLNIDNKGAKIDLDETGRYDNVPITSRVTKMFLGIQTQCTQCHDHPQAKEWLQADFWGVNAFFRQTEKVGTQNTMQKKQTATVNYVELKEMPNWNKKGLVLYERRDGQRKASYPVMLKDLVQAEKGEKSTKNLISATATTKTRRQILADWIVQHDNFEKAYVNRMWGHLFGRGLQKDSTVDDFKSDNEVVHPELLAYLGEQFKQYNHDTKKLLEWLCTSDVYQLSHVAVKGLTDPKFDPFFARMPLKAVSPEVLFDSLSLATRAESRLKEAEYKALKASWTGRLVRNFGDDEGNETTFNGTVIQALLLMNGKDLNDQVGTTRDKGVVAEVVKKNRSAPLAIYDELFLMTVSRHPTKEEVAKLEQVRQGKAVVSSGTPSPSPKGPSPKGPTPKGPTGPLTIVPGAQADDVSFYQDVFWALLNTNEFMLNH
jgi:hypothetical protein